MAEDKMQKSLTVKELKELAPLSEVYEMNKYAKYLVFVEKGDLAGSYELAYQKAAQVVAAMKKLGMTCIVIIGKSDDVKIMEMEVEKV